MSRLRSQTAIGLLATLGWPLAMSRTLVSDFYLALAVVVVATTIAAMLAYRDRLRAWFKVTPVGVAMGLGGGIVQAVLTHAAYRLLAPSFPLLQREVIALYELMNTGLGPTRALPIIVLAILAEELVWRGVLLESKSSAQAGGLGRAAWSTLLYTVAQAGSGSWALMATAFACGWVWWAVRRFSRSLTIAVLVHLVWSLVVLVFVPLEP